MPVAVAAAVGIAGIVLILVLQRWLPKVPAVLIMVVLAIAVTTVFSLADHGVSLVGVLPRDSRRSLSPSWRARDTSHPNTNAAPLRAPRAEGSTTRKAVSGSGLSVTARPVSSRLRTTAFPRAY